MNAPSKTFQLVPVDGDRPAVRIETSHGASVFLRYREALELAALIASVVEPTDRAGVEMSPEESRYPHRVLTHTDASGVFHLHMARRGDDRTFFTMLPCRRQIERLAADSLRYLRDTAGDISGSANSRRAALRTFPDLDTSDKSGLRAARPTQSPLDGQAWAPFRRCGAAVWRWLVRRSQAIRSTLPVLWILPIAAPLWVFLTTPIARVSTSPKAAKVSAPTLRTASTACGLIVSCSHAAVMAACSEKINFA